MQTFKLKLKNTVRGNTNVMQTFKLQLKHTAAKHILLRKIRHIPWILSLNLLEKVSKQALNLFAQYVIASFFESKSLNVNMISTQPVQLYLLWLKSALQKHIYKLVKNVMITALHIFNHLSCGYVTHVTVKYLLVECLNKA